MKIMESFERLVKQKAKNMAGASSWRSQAIGLGIKGDNELRAFKVGGWDAMIFDMAHALNMIKYAESDFRKRLIEQWETEGM
ncbi:hypothetical protein ES703_23682 [subsurface metagenome]